MDHVDRQAEEASSPHVREQYGALRDRIGRYERGDPEMHVERMTAGEFVPPGVVMVVIVAYFAIVVGFA